MLVGGCFELLHYGHYRFLTEARNAGDILIVALESDEFIRAHKHREPIHSQRERAQLLAELRCVDLVLLLPLMHSDRDYADLVKIVKPSIIAATDGDPRMEKKRQHAQEVGAEVLVVTPRVSHLSTTSLRNIGSADNPFDM